MTKSEQNEVKSVKMYVAAGMVDTAARSLSTLIRSARTKTSQSELMAVAIELKLVDDPEFIV